MPKPKAEERGGPLVKEKRKLDEIHARFKYADEQWRQIRKEAKEDMRHVAGDPWDPKEKLAREKAMRPTPANDEISQYLNQVINGVKENKRAIGFNPVGFGADDKTAEFYDGKWREIWYRSHAQQHTARAFQSMVERSYAYCKLRTEYVTDTPGGPDKPWSAFNKRLVIDGIPDPDAVYPDPDFLDATGRDWQWLFELEDQSLRDFRRNFPRAEIQSFSPELVKYSKGWISGNGGNTRIRIAQYWEVEKTLEILNAWEMRDPVSGQTLVYEIFDDELELAEKAKKLGAKLIDKREVETPTVWQYRTNGVEILKKTEWPGRWIPYVGFFGKMMWLDLGKGPELVIQSMVRLARGPNMMLAYYLACEAEMIGMTPKVPYFVWKGSLDRTNAGKLAKANYTPVPYIEVDPLMNHLSGANQQTPSLPEKQLYEPPIQAIELAKEAARRAIQAAMGLTPLPTSAQRRNEKSGVALKQIEESGQRGSYHFIDSYDMGLMRLGELGEDLIPKIHDTAGPTPVLDAQKRPKDAFINAALLPEGQAPKDALPKIDGLHAVTIDTEPDYASQRDKGENFVNTFVASPVFQALPPQMAVQVLALMVKLLDLGPIGTEIADILHPKDQEEGMVPAQKYQEAVQMGNELIQALQAKIQEYEQERQAKVIETEGKLAITAQQNESKERIAGAQVEAKLVDRDKWADTMILLEKIKQHMEMLALHAGSEQEKIKIAADVSKTAAQLEQSTAMSERDRESAEREGAETRAHEASEGEAARQAESQENAATRLAASREAAAQRASADRNAAEDRKIKAKQASKPNGKA